MSRSAIPFLDLVTVHRELKTELQAVLESALDTAGFIGGPVVQEFERAFAQFCRTRFCVGMSNGTDALRLALIAAGVQPGDTVVTVPNTFIATAEASSRTLWIPPGCATIWRSTVSRIPERVAW
jgi:dTDP-4-amino-4,6-dideoxygalactose transaminase